MSSEISWDLPDDSCWIHRKVLALGLFFFSVVHFFLKLHQLKISLAWISIDYPVSFFFLSLCQSAFDVLIFSVIHGPVLRISKRANSAQIALCAVLLSCDKRSEILLDKRRRRNKEQLFLIEIFLSGRHNDIQNVSF